MLRDKIVQKLNLRKTQLAISYEGIAKRARVGVATVKRVYDARDVSVGKIESIMEALGLDDNLRPKMSTSKMIASQIEYKTEMILSRVIHTSALELQEPSSKTQALLRKQIKSQLAKLPRSKIWQ
ncbi:MAG: XRE family transcriptional regulator [Erysipelotrichia bacterium]|nr:XRE family transcriptional regulator [Erysipelotrichia bacterium]